MDLAAQHDRLLHGGHAAGGHRVVELVELDACCAVRELGGVQVSVEAGRVRRNASRTVTVTVTVRPRP